MQESEGEHVPKEQEPQRVERMRRVIDRRRDATRCDEQRAVLTNEGE